MLVGAALTSCAPAPGHPRPTQETPAALDLLAIPVVVHVVLDSSRLGLLSPAVVFSQIEALDRDFGPLLDREHLRDILGDHGRLDASRQLGLVAAPCLVFRLAEIDPSGATCIGITYTETATPNWDVQDPAAPLKFTTTGGRDAWPSDRYLNIWVADCRADGRLGERQGHASPPGGPSAEDGIVVDYRAFGDHSRADLPSLRAVPFVGRELGRTVTHEVGHWLGLQHLWGETEGACSGAGDGIDDTPAQAARNGYCTSTSDSCPNDAWSDLCNNFMDYAADEDRVMFTLGQVKRMRQTLVQQRSELLSQLQR